MAIGIELPHGDMAEVAAGKVLFAEAMLKGTMEGFFKLIEQYRTQDEPAFCGLARYVLACHPFIRVTQEALWIRGLNQDRGIALKVKGI